MSVRLRYTFTGTFEAEWEDYTDPGPEGILDPHPGRLAAIVQESVMDGGVVAFFERFPTEAPPTSVLIQAVEAACCRWHPDTDASAGCYHPAACGCQLITDEDFQLIQEEATP